MLLYNLKLIGYISIFCMYELYLYRLMEEPAAYGKFGLANLLELREECLREFQFMDAYKTIKQRLEKHALFFSLFFPS